MAETKVVVFKIGGEDYAADIRDVQEVIRPPSVTPLPNPSPPLVGVFNLRGHIVTALDGHQALGFGPSPSPAGRTVIFQAKGRTVGLLVDAANQVLTVDEDDVKPPADEAMSRSSKGILIHEDHPIVLLDIEFLLDPHRGPHGGTHE